MGTGRGSRRVQLNLGRAYPLLFWRSMFGSQGRFMKAWIATIATLLDCEKHPRKHQHRDDERRILDYVADVLEHFLYPLKLPLI